MISAAVTARFVTRRSPSLPPQNPPHEQLCAPTLIPKPAPPVTGPRIAAVARETPSTYRVSVLVASTVIAAWCHCPSAYPPATVQAVLSVPLVEVAQTR